MDKYKCLIRGAYGASNFGDDALLDVIYKKLLSIYTEQEIAVWGSNNAYISQWYPNSKVIVKKDLYKIKCKNLIYGGGTQFYDFGKARKPKQFLSLFFNPIYALNKLNNRLFNKGVKPVEYDKEFYLAIGLGPFLPNSKIKENILTRMKLSSFVSLRDNKSMNFAKEGNVKAIKTVDICLSKEVREGKKDNGRIAVVLRDWEHTQSEYTIEGLIEQIKGLDINKVDFITFGPDKKLKEFIKNNNLSSFEWNPYTMTINKFLDTLGNYKMVFSSRYHGVIYSVLLGIPVIALPIEPKLVQASIELSGVILYDPEMGFAHYKNQIENNYDKITADLLETKKRKYIESNKTIDTLLESL